MKINIDKAVKYQTFEGIGASGAWWAQLTGKWTSVMPDGQLTKDKIAELLYSKDKGIGMRTYRYNLGGGSAQSGRGDYWNPERRAESFDTDEGGYDFTADAAAVYMMKKAVEAGADEVIFFVNSPIERLTKNHKAHVDKNRTGTQNLPKKNVDAFVKYTLDVTEHFLKEGMPIKYISPINEPLWVWNGGQEGCHYMPRYAGKVMRAFAIEMDKRPALKDVKLSGLENGDIRWFNKSYTRNLMKYKEVRGRIDSVDLHSYFLRPFFPFNDRPGYLRRFNKYVSRRYPEMNIKMSEWCHMCGGRDKTMVSGLVTANTMFEDISIMNAASWSHWIACSNVDYCDGLLYIYPETETFEFTKRYYVTGNFSKYVPFGAKRIKAETDTENVKVVAFTNGNKTEIILINNGEEPQEISFDCAYTLAVTDKDSDLKETSYAAGEKTVITPLSVTTVIMGDE